MTKESDGKSAPTDARAYVCIQELAEALVTVLPVIELIRLSVAMPPDRRANFERAVNKANEALHHATVVLKER